MKLVRHLGPVFGVIVLLAAGAFAWAWLGATPPCADPSCARERFSVYIEVDRFDRVEPIALEVPVRDGGNVSVASVLGSGGIDVQLSPGSRTLPFAAASGKLDRADLYAFAQEWRDRAPNAKADAHLYAMLAPAIVSDTGEDLFGLMFDSNDREGFAVAPGEIAARFSANQPESVATLQLRTFIHELLHSLNRRHGEAAQMPDERLTLEAPTRCISGNTLQRDWTLNEEPLMALSPHTILFFQTASANEVLPGRESAPFLFGSTSTCRDIRATIVNVPEVSRWHLAVGRFKSLFGIPSARAAEAVEPAESDQSGERPEETPVDVAFSIQALPSAYPLGYPVAVRLTVVNRGERALPLAGRLSPGYGHVQIEVREAPGAPWTTVQPIAWFEPIDDDEAMLPPGARTEQTIPIFFNRDRWTFPVTGTYEVRANLHLGDDGEDVVTDPIEIRIERPVAGRDFEALQLMISEEGGLRDEMGRSLLMGGRTRDAQSDALIDRLASDFRETALGEAVQLTRASRLLRQPIDPRTGERAPPDIAGARALLADSCTDSGVVALRRQLLDFHEDTTQSQPAPSMIVPVEAAWEGSVPRGAPQIATYSDESLRALPQTIHFCHASSALRGPAATVAMRLARDLRKTKPERIVLVGHADQTGQCRYNEALAMRRAEAMRSVLIRAGIPRSRIQVASLGKRRPLDFSATDEAHQLNRRVEILVPAELADAFEPGEPAMPDCPGS